MNTCAINVSFRPFVLSKRRGGTAFILLCFLWLALSCSDPARSARLDDASRGRSAANAENPEHDTSTSLDASEETSKTPLLLSPVQRTQAVEKLKNAGTLGVFEAFIRLDEWHKPDLNAVLYLLRAARYEAALELAQRLEGKLAAERFILAKSAILASKKDLEPRPSLLLSTLLADHRDPELTPIYEAWRVRALFLEGQFADAWDALLAFGKGQKSSEDVRKISLWALDLCHQSLNNAECSASLTDKRWPQIDSLMGRVSSAGNAFEAAMAIYWRMELAKIRDPARAKKHKKELVWRYPATQMSLWPELAEDLASSLSMSERLSRIDRLVRHFDYDNARAELKTLLAGQGLSKDAYDKAEWQLAKISLNHAEEPGLSEDIYRKRSKVASKLREEATFGIARALSRQGRYEAAIAALEDYTKRYPKGKYAMRALYLKGWYWFELRENAKARPYLLEYSEKTNDTAHWGFYAQSFVREGRWKEANAAFEHLLRNSNPIVRGKALYWQAYGHHALGDEARAQSLLTTIHNEFPLTYYDILAHQREADWFGADYDAAIAAKFKPSEVSDLDNDYGSARLLPWGVGIDYAQVSKLKVWQDVLKFINVDEVDAARGIYRRNEAKILASVPASIRETFKRYATHLTENYNAAWEEASGSVRALSKVEPDRTDPRQQMAYPQAFAPLVETLSARFGVPKYFVYGIMLQESRFRPYQVSSADAIGALQMIPKTARVIAKELGLSYHPSTFFDPKVGFIYSLYYMKMHLDMWQQNLCMTAGSYNGGPHRIGPWMLRDKGQTLDFLVEEFSFDESRHYARKVTEHSLRYLYLYAKSSEEWRRVVDMLFPRVVNYDIPTDDWGI